MASKGENPADPRCAEDPAGPGVSASSEAVSSIPFEQAVSELESIVQRMESGSLTLEESVAAYRRGAALVAHCRRTLADVQQQVSILEGGMLEPFSVDDDAGGATR